MFNNYGGPKLLNCQALASTRSPLALFPAPGARPSAAAARRTLVGAMTTQNFAPAPVATAPTTPGGSPRTYDVRTHGCQMNVHDSERLAGLLETAGYVDVNSVPADDRPGTADVVVF